MGNRKQTKERNSPPPTKKQDLNADRKVETANKVAALSELALALITVVNLATLTFVSKKGPSFTEPLYGNVFSKYLFSQITLTSLLGGFLLGYYFKINERSISYCYILIGVLLSCTYTPGLWLINKLDYLGPWIAPHAYQAVFCYPICFLVGLTSATGGRTFARLLSPSMILFKSVLYIWGLLIVINKWGGLIQFETTCQSALIIALIPIVAAVTLECAPSVFVALGEHENKPTLFKKAFTLVGSGVVIASIYYTSSYVGQCQRGVVEGIHNHPGSKWNVLAREENSFGWISVVEESGDRNIRVMKAGHSLIGGVYQNTNESIFGSFYFLEAALDFQRSKPKQEKALQIGLGIGVSTSSLLQKGVEVDVVEINPVVYSFAQKYFELPTPTEVYFQDGRKFIETAPKDQYDYILHDVFTGGSVPPSLFTEEALLHIKRILKADGILALNFVGSPVAPNNLTMAHITHTLKQVFPEILCFTEGEDRHTLHNLVYFASQYPLTWSKSVHDDEQSMRGDMMTQIRNNPHWQVDTTYDPDLVNTITDLSNPLPKLQMDSSWEHWKIMRELFPTSFWENY